MNVGENGRTFTRGLDWAANYGEPARPTSRSTAGLPGRRSVHRARWPRTARRPSWPAQLAQVVGSHGPQAEAVIGPTARRTAYRYRGTEKTPDKHIVDAYDSGRSGRQARPVPVRRWWTRQELRAAHQDQRQRPMSGRSGSVPAAGPPRSRAWTLRASTPSWVRPEHLAGGAAGAGRAASGADLGGARAGTQGSRRAAE